MSKTGSVRGRKKKFVKQAKEEAIITAHNKILGELPQAGKTGTSQ